MKNENEKKGLFDRLNGIKKTKKSSCCGSFEIEEIPKKTKKKRMKKSLQKAKVIPAVDKFKVNT